MYIHKAHVSYNKVWLMREYVQKYRKYLFCRKFDSMHVAKKALRTSLLSLDLVLIVSRTKAFCDVYVAIKHYEGGLTSDSVDI